jgi:hypothetical protein
MLLTVLTVFHTALSLIGIGSGVVVLYGLLTKKPLPGWTKLFLATTVATSVTGFFFPFHKFLPSHGVAILSLIVLAIAIRAHNRWRRTYAITAVMALYFNVFVLIAQLFLKVPALNALAPTQSEPPFQIAQGVNLLLFTFLAIRAAMKSRAQPSPKTFAAAS